MGEAAKNNMYAASPKDQSGSENGIGSFFQAWQNPFIESLGDADGSSKPTKSDLQLAISDSSSAQAAYNNNNAVEYPTLGQAIKNPVNGGAGDDDNTGKTDEGQEDEPDIGMGMDPYLLRRLTKCRRVVNWDRLPESLKARLTLRLLQTKAYYEEVLPLLIDQRELKFKLAAIEKEGKMRDAEIQKTMAEVEMLRELHKKRFGAEEPEMMLDGGAD